MYRRLQSDSLFSFIFCALLYYSAEAVAVELETTVDDVQIRKEVCSNNRCRLEDTGCTFEKRKQLLKGVKRSSSGRTWLIKVPQRWRKRCGKKGYVYASSVRIKRSSKTEFAVKAVFSPGQFSAIAGRESRTARLSASKTAEKLMQLEKQYRRLGGNQLALIQTINFLNRYEKKQFIAKRTKSMAYQCNLSVYLKILNKNYVTIVDYTKTSNLKRMFVFDLKRSRVRALYVSHGRFGAYTDRNHRRVREGTSTFLLYNLFPSGQSNSVRKARYFSNAYNSGASTGGFHLATHEYKGKFGRSIVLHGLEKDVNDNSCGRATVIHRSPFIHSSGVDRMSSGCPMVSAKDMNWLLNSIKGNTRGGSLYYVFTPNEEAMGANFHGRKVLVR